jgi:hypothetical protein
MSKKLRVISINVPFADASVVHAPLDSDWALFDFDVVVIRPQQFEGWSPHFDSTTCQYLQSIMSTKKSELDSLFRQGGVLVVFLDVPDVYRVAGDHYGRGACTVDNYDFLDPEFANGLRKGTGTQVTYSTAAEPFVNVLRRSTVAWTSYIIRIPSSLEGLKLFAYAGTAGALGGKMPYGEGHLIILPNVQSLDEKAFFEACAEYRFKRQGTIPPEWVATTVVPGLPPIEDAIADLDKRLAGLQQERQCRVTELAERTSYRKLLYEKGKSQLEPIVLRALGDLDFGTSPGEIIAGTIHEIDGRTTKGSSSGIVEVKGSKNQIAQSEFSPFVTKILADAEVNKKYSKGILVGNGLCETEPSERLGDSVFSPHVLDGAKRNSVALINAVELYWLCCAMLRGDLVDKNAIREAILAGNGYVDLKPFSGQSPF